MRNAADLLTVPKVITFARAKAKGCNLELATLKHRASADASHHVIVRLCEWTSLTVEQLANLLGKDRDYLRNKHLTLMVRDGQLRFRYRESAKHPHQPYVALVDTEEQL